MQHFYQNIQGWFTFPGFYSSVVQQAKDGYHFVEVGSWKGKSTAYMGVEIVNSKKAIVFDTVDTWEGSEEHLDPTTPFYEPLLQTKDGLYNHFLSNIEPIKHIVNPIKKLSTEAALNYENESLNFVFIDASHDYDNVCKDIKAWLPKIKKGGLLAGHDSSYEPIKQALVDTLTTGFFDYGEDVWCYKVKK